MIQRDARLWDRLPACQRCNRSDCQCRQAGCLSHFDLPASRRDFLRGAAAMSALAFVGSASGVEEPPMSLPLVGYNEHRTNLPGGRHANVSTNRAMVVKADGTGRRSIGSELVNEAGTWTQFAGWSPDGRTAVVLRGWESVENARWSSRAVDSLRRGNFALSSHAFARWSLDRLRFKARRRAESVCDVAVRSKRARHDRRPRWPRRYARLLATRHGQEMNVTHKSCFWKVLA